jgi:hypothetical protein
MGSVMKPINLFNASDSPYHGTEQITGINNFTRVVYLWSSGTRKGHIVMDSLYFKDIRYLAKKGFFF